MGGGWGWVLGEGGRGGGGGGGEDILRIKQVGLAWFEENENGLGTFINTCVFVQK